MKSRFFSLIPHAHRWHNISISRQGSLSPSGRQIYSTYVQAQCKGCGEWIYKVYYQDVSDEKALRWLG